MTLRDELERDAARADHDSIEDGPAFARGVTRPPSTPASPPPSKRSTEAVLRDELRSAEKAYGAAVAKRAITKEKLAEAGAVDTRAVEVVAEAKARSKRAVATLEAFLGETLPLEKRNRAAIHKAMEIIVENEITGVSEWRYNLTDRLTEAALSALRAATPGDGLGDDREGAVTALARGQVPGG